MIFKYRTRIPMYTLMSPNNTVDVSFVNVRKIRYVRYICICIVTKKKNKEKKNHHNILLYYTHTHYVAVCLPNKTQIVVRIKTVLDVAVRDEKITKSWLPTYYTLCYTATPLMHGIDRSLRAHPPVPGGFRCTIAGTDKRVFSERDNGTRCIHVILLCSVCALCEHSWCRRILRWYSSGNLKK